MRTADLLEKRFDDAGGATPGPVRSGPILIVDDEEDHRWILREALQEEGFSVVEAKDGRAALELLLTSAAEPKLILLDLNMPVMSGDELLKVMWSYLRLASIPIVLITGADLTSVPASASVAATVSKPISVELLLSLARKYVCAPLRPLRT